MEFEPTDLRAERGLAIARSSRIRQIVTNTFLVPSQTQNRGGYVVDSEKGTCSCPDHELRGEILKCKHRWAVEFVRHRVTGPDGTAVSVDTMRVTYSQNWPRYNAAQCEEKDRALVLLRALCDGVPNPVHAGGPGRPRAALSDVIFAAALKTFVGMSGRRATSDIRTAQEKGLLDKVPSYNAVFDYLGKEDVTPVLKRLITESATPLATIERRFAIDGTGFGSKVYVRWFDEKYGREKRTAKWVKLHAICGTTTNIITAVEVTDATIHDSPLLPQLVTETAEHFQMEEVSGDKGYLAASNLRAIEAVGAVPFIAFKTNSQHRGPDVWQRAFHMFAFNRHEWLQSYHRRSNIETTFSMIKRKFGGVVRAITPTAMANEVLLKVICHNVSCLVHAIHELKVEPMFWGDR